MPSPQNINAVTRQQCPMWCTADHAPCAHEDDRWHVSEGMLLPAAELVTRWHDDGEARFELAAVEIEVALEQRVHGEEAFVHLVVGDDPPRAARLSVESTRRLVRVLNAHVAMAKEHRRPDA